MRTISQRTRPCFALLVLLASLPLAHSVLSAELDKAALQRAISGPDRDVNDFVRDASRKPVEVLAWLGIEEGMQVLDLYAAGGYYTFILAKAVGPEGHVFAQNTPRGLNYEEDRQDITQGEALALKLQRGNINNVSHLISRLDDLPIPEASLDAVLVAQVLHDYYNPNPARALDMLRRLYTLLKPGGFIGITDHVGVAGQDNRDLHRMQIEQAIEVAEQAGFLVESSELLRNPQDDHRRNIFDPRLNRNTDRFLLRLTKPS